jgi:hypothetical protein
MLTVDLDIEVHQTQHSRPYNVEHSALFWVTPHGGHTGSTSRPEFDKTDTEHEWSRSYTYWRLTMTDNGQSGEPKTNMDGKKSEEKLFYGLFPTLANNQAKLISIGRVRKLPPEPYLAISVRYWRACAVKVTCRMVVCLLGEIPLIQVNF